MADNLVIVESPAKAKTIKKYLGRDFEVLASYGHVRDLVPKEGAVDPENDFRMQYRLIDGNEKHVAAISIPWWASISPRCCGRKCGAACPPEGCRARRCA